MCLRGDEEKLGFRRAWSKGTTGVSYAEVFYQTVNDSLYNQTVCDCSADLLGETAVGTAALLQYHRMHA